MNKNILLIGIILLFFNFIFAFSQEENSEQTTYEVSELQQLSNDNYSLRSGVPPDRVSCVVKKSVGKILAEREMLNSAGVLCFS